MPDLSPLEAEQLELLRAQRSVALWALPLLGNRDIPVALDLSPSAWEVLKAAGNGPRLFHFGKRTYALTSELRAWLERTAAAEAANPPSTS